MQTLLGPLDFYAPNPIIFLTAKVLLGCHGPTYCEELKLATIDFKVQYHTALSITAQWQMTSISSTSLVGCVYRVDNCVLDKSIFSQLASNVPID